LAAHCVKLHIVVCQLESLRTPVLQYAEQETAHLYAGGKQLSCRWWWCWSCWWWFSDLRAPCWLPRPPPPPPTHSIAWNLCTGVTIGFPRDRLRCLLCCWPQLAADSEAGMRWRPLKPHVWLRLSIQKCMEDLPSSCDCRPWTPDNHQFCHHKPSNKKLIT
jgi:hypothetical protein